MDSMSDKVFRGVIEEEITNRLEVIGKSLTQIISDYEFIYGNKPVVLYSIIMHSFFENYKPEKNEIHFDFERFLKDTPIEAKQLVFDRLFLDLSKKVSVDDIKNSSKDE